jgi:hypothetical protein
MEEVLMSGNVVRVSYSIQLNQKNSIYKRKLAPDLRDTNGIGRKSKL